MNIPLTVILAVMAATASANLMNAFRNMFPTDYYPYAMRTDVDPGKPLFLTPYLERGEIHKARELSRTGRYIPVEGYSGFLTVNKTINSNMFFWFFPAQVDPETAPVVLWLQGGPGGSSMFGLFAENGPVSVDSDGDIHKTNITWNSRYSMIYIDSPVGTGFSFTGDESGYANNEVDVARDLYSCLTQFFQIFSEYRKNDFYVTGESYAGKYCPAISYKIHMENPTADVKINLKGMAVGDGWCDPETFRFQMVPVYGDFMFYVGLLDENQRDFVTTQGKQIAAYIRQGMYKEAMKLMDALDEEYQTATGLNQWYNYLITNDPPDENYYPKFLARPEARLSLHVGNLSYGHGEVVADHLQRDTLMSIKPWLAEIMDNYKVMLYNGQLDVIVGNPLTEAMLLTVPWKGQEAYRSAKKIVWKIRPSDEEVAGYVRQVGQFYQVVVRDAGHILPHDQPERALDMIERFIENKPFS